MRNRIYLFLCSCLFLSSCLEIPYQLVPNDKAKAMYTYYLDGTSTADHSFKEVPKVTSIDKKTLKSFIKAGKADEVKLIMAAYLAGTIPAPGAGKKNTVLLQIMRLDKDGKKTFTYYDMRKVLDMNSKIYVDKDDNVCPLPPDCTPGIEQ